jgi:hypothetical protein
METDVDAGARTQAGSERFTCGSHQATGLGLHVLNFGHPAQFITDPMLFQFQFNSNMGNSTSVKTEALD